jgi:hypothetical protein
MCSQRRVGGTIGELDLFLNALVFFERKSHGRAARHRPRAIAKLDGFESSRSARPTSTPRSKSRRAVANRGHGLAPEARADEADA